MTGTERCWCCGGAIDDRSSDDPWEGRLDGYCYDCALARCDAYPGECPRKKSYRPFWRHEKLGSRSLAHVLCFLFGHDVNRWQDPETGEWCRGDCHRCWA